MTSTLHAARPANQNASAPIVVWEIRRKDWKRFGHVYEGEVFAGHHAEIVPGKSIRLFGLSERKYARNAEGKTTLSEREVYKRDFTIGDEAECHSFNITYTGTITAIGEKTVTIVEYHGTPNAKTYRLDLYWFARRNWDFDAQATAERNAAWRD